MKADQIVRSGSATDDFDIVDARLLHLLPDLVVEMGGDPQALLRQAGIDPEAFMTDRSRASYRQIVDVVDLAANVLDCPDFGMKLASYQAGRIPSPLMLAMKTSRTLGEAIAFVTSHSHVHSLAADVWVRKAGGKVMLGHDILLEGLPHRSQTMEQILLVTHLCVRDGTGGAVGARRVLFRHQPVAAPAVYRRYFGCDVRFGQQMDAVVFQDEDLACPMIARDLNAHEETIAYIEAEYPLRRPPLHATVRGMVMHRLGMDPCGNEEVAALLHLHPRTLHRRLAEEGTTFQQIKHEVRRDMMLYYLRRTDLDLTTISERLGFAEQSAMTRYCRKCFGLPPTGLRSGGHGVQGA